MGEGRWESFLGDEFYLIGTMSSNRLNQTEEREECDRLRYYAA